LACAQVCARELAAKGQGQEAWHLRGPRDRGALSDTETAFFYFHTQNNRRLRMVDLKRIDFSPETGGSQYFPLDKNKPQDIEDMTPHEQ